MHHGSWPLYPYISTDGEDYMGLTAHRLVFPVATPSRRVCVAISIINDMQVEKTEKFFVNLQKDPRMPENVLIGPRSTASVTVLDNDGPGIREAPYNESMWHMLCFLDAVYGSYTPAIQGNTIVINFIVRRRHFTFSHILCTLKGPGQTPPITRNCKIFF